MMHSQLQQRLSEYLDGTLTARARARVEEHLGCCQECRNELAELRGTVRLLRSLPPVEDADEFLATRVLARIEAGDAAPTWRDRGRYALASALSSAWTPALGAAAALFIVATALRVQIDIKLPGSPAPATAAVLGGNPQLAAQPVSLAGEIHLVQTPVHSRRRFDPVVLEEVSGVHRACSARPHDVECQSFRNKLVELALANPPRFLREIEMVPLESRDRVLSEVSLEAARTGHAQRVIYGLRRVDDPRAFGIVVHFQRTIASRE